MSFVSAFVSFLSRIFNLIEFLYQCSETFEFYVYIIVENNIVENNQDKQITWFPLIFLLLLMYASTGASILNSQNDAYKLLFL